MEKRRKRNKRKVMFDKQNLKIIINVLTQDR